MLLQVKKLAKNNELKLASFLIVEHSNLQGLGDVFDKLGNAFINVSTEEESIDKWRALKKYDSASMLCFGTAHSI